MVNKLYRRRRRVRRDLPDLRAINPIGVLLAGCYVWILKSEDPIEKALLLLVLSVCYCIVYGIWKLWTNLSGDPSFPYILIVCATIAVLLLMVTNENALRKVNCFLFYNAYNTMSTMQHVVQNLANQAYTQCFDMLKAATRLILLVYNHFIIRFLEIPWQVLYYVLNFANDICCWFYVNVLRLLALLHDNYPGGIPGIVLSFFVIILLQRLRRLSKAHDRCVANLLASEDIKSNLQVQLEHVQSQLHTANEELKQESERVRKLRSSLEEEMDKRLCGICQDQIKTILLLPCNHMCLCKQCLDREQWKKCPICRESVQSTVMAYV